MAISLKKKQELVGELKDGLQQNGLIILAEFKALSVAETTDIRNKLAESSVSYKVHKNTLVKHAIEELDANDAQMKKLFDYLSGPTAVAYSVEKPFEAAKLMSDFARANDKISVKCGFFEGKYLAKAEVEQLAAIGSKDMLLSRLLSALKSPISRLNNALKAPQTNLYLTLKAVVDKKEKE